MHIKNIVVLKALIVSLLLTPSLAFVPGFPAIRFDDILILAWLLIFLLCSPFNVRYLYKTRLIFIVILTGYIIIPILNGIVNGYEGALGDLNQYVRFIKYIGVYLLAGVVFSKSDGKQIADILAFTLKCGVVLVAIALSQYVNPFGINEAYVQLVAPTQYETLVGGYPNPRPVGMIGNSNELGFVMVLLSLLGLFVVYRYRQSKSYLYLAVFFVGLVLTLSRSSLVAYLFGVATFFFWIIFKGTWSTKIKVFMTLLFFFSVLSATLVQPQVYERFTWRFAKLAELSSDGSTQTRFENWSENWDMIKSHPLIGVGPLRRAQLEHSADNEWLLLWRSYGLVGLMLVICFYLRGVFSRRIMEYKALHLSIVTSSFIYMIPAASFYSLVIFPVVLILMAMIDQKGNVA